MCDLHMVVWGCPNGNTVKEVHTFQLFQLFCIQMNLENTLIFYTNC